jgi:DNA repair metallo-beta-lactamase
VNIWITCTPKQEVTGDPKSINTLVTSKRLKEYIKRWKGQWTKAIAFRPTGWTCRLSPPDCRSVKPTTSQLLAARWH